jgi:hypothetical protein
MGSQRLGNLGGYCSETISVNNHQLLKLNLIALLVSKLICLFGVK